MCGICSKLIIKTPERIKNNKTFEQISYFVLVFPFLTSSKQIPAVKLAIYCMSYVWNLLEVYKEDNTAQLRRSFSLSLILHKIYILV